MAPPLNPLQKNKVDISSMSEEEQKAFKLYGKLPAKNLITKMQKERKYFDSGDYMMSKAGVASAQAPGTAIPTPEGVPHASPPSAGPAGILGSPPPTGAIPVPSSGGDSGIGGARSPGAGVSPAATSEAIEVPSIGHARRQSESHRTSPPGLINREGSMPSSSFPIQHNNLGSSPVKSSNLGRS